jgi:chromosome segregation ATPase
MHGNTWLRLLRREVEELVRSRNGEVYLRERQARTELSRVNRELKQLRTQIAELEKRRALLLSDLGESRGRSSPRGRAPHGDAFEISYDHRAFFR